MKYLILLSVLFLVGCDCGSKGKSTYEVKCYSNGKIIFKGKARNQPVLRNGGLRWRNMQGKRVRVIGTCISTPVSNYNNRIRINHE